MTTEAGLVDFYQRQQQEPELIHWSLGGLDTKLRTEPGDFVVIGGYSSAGKTALSLQLAWGQAEQRRVGYFSLETKPEKLIDRTVSMVTGVDFGRIKSHTLTGEDWTSCAEHSAAINARQLELIKAGGLSVADIQALALSGRYELIYIDYLQLIRAEDARRSDYEKVSQISRDLHTMAQITGITVVALSQLSRPEKKAGKESAPTMHSLRQSGQIEQDADGILLLYKEAPNDPASRRCLKLAKNKDGEAGGVILLDFRGSTQTFAPAERTSSTGAYFSGIGRDIKRRTLAGQTKITEITTPDPDLPFGPQGVSQ
jgi:replicative DNA helicase